MAELSPSKNDIQTIFNQLRSISTNKTCFDCNSKNPTWASVTYGIFICIDCSAVHRSLGVHLTFVRSTQLDTNWTWPQIRQMQLGGNANAISFFRQHNCTTTDAQQKYNSRAAQLYREKLHQKALQAMKLYGTKLELDSQDKANPSKISSPSVLLIEASPEPVTTTKETKEIDFFEEQTSNDNESFEPPPLTPNNNAHSKEDLVSNPSAHLIRGEPNVNLTPTTLPAERKSTICGRKPQAKKTGLGTKKGGLGAQKVKTNFAEIEREATIADQLRVQAVEDAKQTAEKNAEELQKERASMRLAYQDLSIQQKKEEEKLRQVDPKKAQQVERLGMGFSSRSGVSHSAVSDMQTIEQETPTNSGNGGSGSRSSFERDDSFFEDFHIVSGLSMYKSSSHSEPKGLESLLTSTSDRKTSSWNTSTITSSFEPSEDHKHSTTPVKKEPSSNISNSGEAQRKFGSAKAISSDQYFGDSPDTAWERKNNLARFEGSSSISSADYFGTNSGNNNSASGYSSNIQTPDIDLQEMRESVRQGVIKAAVKLGSLANGVMSSIQDRYGY